MAIQFRIPLGAALLALSCSDLAQAESTFVESTAEATQAGVIEEVVVTGSRIPRRDFTTLSPLTTVDKAAIHAWVQHSAIISLHLPCPEDAVFAMRYNWSIDSQ